MPDRPATTSRTAPRPPRPPRPGRKRRLAGWLLLAIGVLITGVWGASRLWTFGYQAARWRIEWYGGQMQINGYRSDIVRGTGWMGSRNPLETWRWTLGGNKIQAVTPTRQLK